jgi:hypothetical protein
MGYFKRLILLLFFVFRDRVPLCNQDSPASASQALGLKVSATTPGKRPNFEFVKTVELLKLSYVSNVRPQDDKKGKIWLNSDAFVCQVDKGSFVLATLNIQLDTQTRVI